MKTTARKLQIAMAGLFMASTIVYAGDDVVRQQAATTKSYPLKTCIVSGDELGSMGKEVIFNYENQQIKLCCKACIKEFNANPNKFIKLLNEKSNKQTKK